MKEHDKFCNVWIFEPDIANSFGEITLIKSKNLKRMYELINAFAAHQFRSFLIASIPFVIDCKL